LGVSSDRVVTGTADNILDALKLVRPNLTPNGRASLQVHHDAAAGACEHCCIGAAAPISIIVSPSFSKNDGIVALTRTDRVIPALCIERVVPVVSDEDVVSRIARDG
jgi:hypothetical protein